MKLIFAFIGFVLAFAARAEDVTVATLNCYLDFSPSVQHVGKLDEEHPLTSEQYTQKVENLASLARGCSFVGLQEVGGRVEVIDLAKKAGVEWGFARGKDTYTGEEVGALYSLPGWNVAVRGRVGALDAIISKHLYVVAEKGGVRIHFLVLHLIRPIGNNAEKHQRQISAVAQWSRSILNQDPEATVIILGDMNSSVINRGSSLFGVGTEAGEMNNWQATHLTQKPFDRIVLSGQGSFKAVEVAAPPYGKRPNDLQKSLWTDHFLLKAIIETR